MRIPRICGWAALLLLTVVPSRALEESVAETEKPVTAEQISALLARWRDRSSATYFEIGGALSRAFVSNPDAFLNQMSHDSKSWFAWLDGLPRHSFTAPSPEDRSRREQLLSKMAAVAEGYPSTKSLSRMAKQIAEHLQGVEVKDAD